MLHKNLLFHIWITSSEAGMLTKSKNKNKILLLRSYTYVNNVYFTQGYKNYYRGWNPLYELLYWITLMFTLMYTEVTMSIFLAEQNLFMIEKACFDVCYYETVLFFEETEQSLERNLIKLYESTFISTIFSLECFLPMSVIYFRF